MADGWKSRTRPPNARGVQNRRATELPLTPGRLWRDRDERGGWVGGQRRKQEREAVRIRARLRSSAYRRVRNTRGQSQRLIRSDSLARWHARRTALTMMPCFWRRHRLVMKRLIELIRGFRAIGRVPRGWGGGRVPTRPGPRWGSRHGWASGVAPPRQVSPA
ncbi:hypothetical protein SKAU_G00148080 [Synaphobranchus kaupii]|uniref:Uncharacterized protein n=1 Tax=Synaphobranchus kaupii TaxID=118154 RepID=A0A9Q1FTN5_SYNKA|nr:hypothetical protein SKAU_G00148080 [Synaphobranchus kaupii]